MTADADRPFRKPTPPPVYNPAGDTAFKCLTCGLVVVGTVCPKCGPPKPEPTEPSGG